MNRMLKTALTLGLAAALTSSVLAQRGQAPQQGQAPPQAQAPSVPSPIFLFFIPDVKKELKLNEEQMGKLKNSLDKVSAKYKDDFAKLIQKQPPFEEQLKFMRSVNADSYETIKGVLDAKQFQRFKQIEWQLSPGNSALLDPQLQKDLKLSDEQKKQLDGIVADTGKKVDEMIKKKEFTPEKNQAINKEAEKKLNDLLTEEQQKNLKELKGPKFEIATPAPPPQPKKQ